MRKSVVVALIVLALIVLVSPGIVGRLAERSVDQGLERAASHASDVSITSQRYDRGWFSSAGQHRIEIREGTLRDILVAIVEPETPEDLPALIIDTRLDHGLIPVASMGREKGSLLPGLGSAVSTLRVEFPGGETVAVPGSIHSTIGVTGELESGYLLQPGSFAAEGGELRWGGGTIVVTSNPADGRLGIRATLDPVAAESPQETLRLGALEFDLMQTPSRFGFPVGETELTLESLSIGSSSATTIGPLSFKAASRALGNRVTATGTFRLENAPIEPFGAGTISAGFTLANADGAALARLQRGFDDLLAEANPQIAEAMLQADVQRLLAAGIELHIDHFDLELPEGTVSAKSSLSVSETNATGWAALLAALDGTLGVTLPAAVFDRIATLRPEMRTVVALGYLQRHADDYRLEMALTDGRLEINGAPMQIPLDAFR